LMLAALQRDDDTYLDILDDYDRGRDRSRGDRAADLFSEAFAELLAEMERTNRDVLGDAYEAFGMQDDSFGQHFTPHNVAAMLAELQTQGGDAEPPITIADPACGSGRLLVLAARRHDEQTLCFGQDKDLLCAQMAALNACFFNLDAVLVWGDSLTVETRRAWQTRGTAIGGDIREVEPDEVPWPEAAFESTPDDADTEADGQTDASGGEPASSTTDRLTVTADSSGLEQSDLGAWSQ